MGARWSPPHLLFVEDLQRPIDLPVPEIPFEVLQHFFQVGESGSGDGLCTRGTGRNGATALLGPQTRPLVPGPSFARVPPEWRALHPGKAQGHRAVTRWFVSGT